MNKDILYFDDTTEEMRELLSDLVPEGFNLLLWENMDDTEKERKLATVEYLLVAMKKLNEELLSKAKSTRFIQKTGIGVDNIDLESADKHQLPVSNTPGANATGVSELTILLTLALYRKLIFANENSKKGKWVSWDVRPFSFEMNGKIHGIVGFGNIGRKVAKLSKAFGTKIVYYDAFRASEEVEKELDVTYMPIEELLKVADIVSLHIPLLPETRNLIGYRELELMKSNAVLINVSRGGIINEEELYRGLKDGQIAGAGVDVWEEEPINPNNLLLTLENVIATPHIGAGTKDTLITVLSMAFDNIKSVEEGNHPKYVVNNVKKARDAININDLKRGELG